MWSYLKEQIFQQRYARPPEAPIYLCCYHKVGTRLLAKVFSRICAEFDWTFKKVFGKCQHIPTDADVILFVHSLVDLDAVSTPYVGAHFIRDPRDVIVSGYLYHKRCKEPWCTNTNFDLSEPIRFPVVPASQQHRPEAWKKAYLTSLGNKSYQQNLLERTESEGLLFEMHHYGAWTIERMLDWNYGNPCIEEVQFETIMSDFDGTFKKLFERFGWSNRQVSRALRIAAREDLSRMSDKQVQQHAHVSSRKVTKWQKYFEDVHKDAFKQRFGDALIQLGYEESDQW